MVQFAAPSPRRTQTQNRTLLPQWIAKYWEKPPARLLRPDKKDKLAEWYANAGQAAALRRPRLLQERGRTNHRQTGPMPGLRRPLPRPYRQDPTPSRRSRARQAQHDPLLRRCGPQSTSNNSTTTRSCLTAPPHGSSPTRDATLTKPSTACSNPARDARSANAKRCASPPTPWHRSRCAWPTTSKRPTKPKRPSGAKEGSKRSRLDQPARPRTPTRALTLPPMTKNHAATPNNRPQQQQTPTANTYAQQ